jgi:hypothetical protein
METYDRFFPATLWREDSEIDFGRGGEVVLSNSLG